MLNKVYSQGFCSFLSTPNILFYQNSTFCCIQNSFHKKFFELYHNQIYFKTILHTARCQSTLLIADDYMEMENIRVVLYL